MTQLTVGSLFSGIGGLDLGLERAGMRVAWQCETDEWCRGILGRHWPDVPCYDDVRTIDGDDLERVDVLAGGFPCQPVSDVGKKLAQADPRWLWPHFARLVGELRPRYVVVENVPGLVRRGLCDVVGDLAALRYDTEWQLVSAAALGAPHLRERLFVVAYPDTERERREATSQPDSTAQPGIEKGAHRHDANGFHNAFPDTDREGQPNVEGGAGQAGSDGWAVFGTDDDPRGAHGWSPEPGMGRVAHGVPAVLDRLRGLGNAVVPQVAEYVGRLIVEADAA